MHDYKQSVTFSLVPSLKYRLKKPSDIFLLKAGIPVVKVLIKIIVNFGLTELLSLENKKTYFEQLWCILFQILSTSSNSDYQTQAGSVLEDTGQIL